MQARVPAKNEIPAELSLKAGIRNPPEAPRRGDGDIHTAHGGVAVFG